MTHPNQILAQEKDRIERELLKQKKKEKVKFDKHRDLAVDQELVKKLCTFAGKEPSEDNLQHCTLKQFAHRKATCAELKIFIWYHHPDIKLKKHIRRIKEYCKMQLRVRIILSLLHTR